MVSEVKRAQSGQNSPPQNNSCVRLRRVEQKAAVMIDTARLKLLPATVALARAEIGDRGEFARLLGAVVPDNWPPRDPRRRAALVPGTVGGGAGSCRLVRLVRFGSGRCGGRAGPGGERRVHRAPQDGTAEIGYSVLPQFQGRGYATEMVVGLVRWALGQPGVARVAAETEWANPASMRVLGKAGFTFGGPAKEPSGARFEFPGGA